MEAGKETRKTPGVLATIAVVLCGVCAFLEVYCTQPMLPMLERIFGCTKSAAGMTVSATTLGVAIAAPIFGTLAERLPRKKVLVAALYGIAIPTLLTATSTTLWQLVFWRFLQGVCVPGIIAVVITYIGEEWPREKLALIMSFYVSGTALGGFIGRMSSGILAEYVGWHSSFVAVGSMSLLGAFLVHMWLPGGSNRSPLASSSEGEKLPAIYQMQELFRRPRLVATFAVGFNVLFSLVGVFSWITFHLAAAPFNMSTAALSYLFLVYLVGLVVTPTAGFIITKVGLRAGIAGAICCSMAGVALTLLPSVAMVILGLVMVSSGVFISQTASQSHLRVAAPPEARVTAAGLYLTCYYLGGTAAGVVPGIFWSLGKWPACAAFIMTMQAVALTVAVIGWRVPSEKSKSAVAV